MYKLSCFCKTKTKNFKKNIGPFYGGSCCEEAGYDITGEKIDNVEVGDLNLEAVSNDEDSKVESTNIQVLDEIINSKDRSSMKLVALKAEAAEMGIDAEKCRSKKEVIELIEAKESE